MNIKKLNKYVGQVMRNFPNVDGVIIVDTDAIVRYYFSAYEKISKVAGNEIIGKNILSFYPELNEDNSYIIRCIKTGKAFLNYEQELTDINGNTLRSICQTVPIHDGGELVAIAELSTYPDKTVEEEDKKIEVANLFHAEHINGTLDDIITANPAFIDIKNTYRQKRPAMLLCLFTEKRAQARNWYVMQYTTAAAELKNRLLFKTAPPYRQLCWKACCSET